MKWIAVSLSMLFAMPGFAAECERWRNDLTLNFVELDQEGIARFGFGSPLPNGQPDEKFSEAEVREMMAEGALAIRERLPVTICTNTSGQVRIQFIAVMRPLPRD